MVREDKEAEVFVSHCPAFGVYSQGESEAEAVAAIKSALSMHVGAAYKHGRLEQILRRAGFERVSSGKIPASPSQFIFIQRADDVKEIGVGIPLILVAANAASECPQ